MITAIDTNDGFDYQVLGQDLERFIYTQIIKEKFQMLF